MLIASHDLFALQFLWWKLLWNLSIASCLSPEKPYHCIGMDTPQACMYLGLFAPAFVANVGEGLVKPVTVVMLGGHVEEWHIPSEML